MKPDIHPAYVVTEVTCSCGNTFTTRSTAPNGSIHVETCNVCHPFYTGKQRVLDTAGRVAKFQQKYAKAKAAAKATGKTAAKSAGKTAATTPTKAAKKAATK
jgi:large subunit ribosomal protein L31